MKYKINPDVLARVAKEVVAEDLAHDAMFQSIRDKLSVEYPGLVDTAERCWMGSRAGGILGKMTMLYASLDEYLIIFGCPVGSQGFSGRYNFMEISDFYIAGETLTCDLENGQTEPSIYLAGDRSLLTKGQTLSCEIKA